jgi:hypothetical protein
LGSTKALTTTEDDEISAGSNPSGIYDGWQRLKSSIHDHWDAMAMADGNDVW